jgi:hypothetical protein
MVAMVVVEVEMEQEVGMEYYKRVLILMERSKTLQRWVEEVVVVPVPDKCTMGRCTFHDMHVMFLVGHKRNIECVYPA